MAIPTSIKTLLAGNAVEWARVEFKETWDAAASLKTVCAGRYDGFSGIVCRHGFNQYIARVCEA